MNFKIKLTTPTVVFLLLAAAALAAFFPVINAPVFDGDDVLHMMRSQTLWEQFNWSTIKHVFQFEQPSEPELIYRPIIIPIFLLDYLASPGRTYGARLINLGFHALNCLLLFCLAVHLRLKRPAALALAVAYCLHPMVTANVSYIACTPYITIVTQFLGCLLLLRRGLRERSNALLAVGLLLYGLGIAEVETILPLPAVLFLFNELLFPLEAKRRRRFFVYGGMAALIATNYAVIWSRIHTLGFNRGYDYARVRMWQRFADLHLNPATFLTLPFKAWFTAPNPGAVPHLAAVLMPIMMGCGALLLLWLGRSWSGRRKRIAAAGVLWTIITFVLTYPEVQSAQLDWAQSKFYYLPFCGLALAFGALFPQRSARSPGAMSRTTALAAVIVIVACLGPLAYVHCQALAAHGRLIERLAAELDYLRHNHPPPRSLVIFPFPLQHTILTPPRDIIETAFLLLNRGEAEPDTWYYVSQPELAPEAAALNDPGQSPFYPGAVVVAWNSARLTPTDCTASVREWHRLLSHDGRWPVLFYEGNRNCLPDCRDETTSVTTPIPQEWHLAGKVRKITMSSMKLW